MTRPDLSSDLPPWVRIPEPEGMDEKLVLQALKAYRRLSRMFRYGGLGYDYKLAGHALEAFDRLRESRQGRLWIDESNR